MIEEDLRKTDDVVAVIHNNRTHFRRLFWFTTLCAAPLNDLERYPPNGHDANVCVTCLNRLVKLLS